MIVPFKGRIDVKKLLVVMTVGIVIWLIWGPWTNGVRKDFALHVFQDAARRMEKAVEYHPNDHAAMLYACMETKSPIQCNSDPSGRGIIVTYFIGKTKFAVKKFTIVDKPQLVYGVTEYP